MAQFHAKWRLWQWHPKSNLRHYQPIWLPDFSEINCNANLYEVLKNIFNGFSGLFFCIRSISFVGSAGAPRAEFRRELAF
jgi:hypothetical protein